MLEALRCKIGNSFLFKVTVFMPQLPFDYAVIVEEAAEVLESHVISSLTADCQQLIMIGNNVQSNYQNKVKACNVS